MEFKGKQVNIRLTDKQYNQLIDCCDMMGISKSDFIRNATMNYINQCYIQEMMSTMYSEFKKINLSKATEKELGEFSALMDMFKQIAEFGKD